MLSQVVFVLCSLLVRGDDCPEIDDDLGKKAISLSLFAHQREALSLSAHCRKESECPKKWAVSCLDHFNCENILADATEALVSGLRRLGQTEIWSGRASDCLLRVSDCRDRQHIVLNANLMDDDWAQKMPRSSILYNLEQLVTVPRPEAIEAAKRAMADPNNDQSVIRQGTQSLSELLVSADNHTLGVSVDDYRKFIPVPRAAYAFRWLDFSYKNVNLLRNYEKKFQCILIKPLALPSTQQDSGLRRFELYDNEELLPLFYLADDSQAELEERIETLIIERGLEAGAGCTSATCVGTTLVKSITNRQTSQFAAEKSTTAIHLGGHGSVRRMAVIEELISRGFSASVLEGAFGRQRDQLLNAAGLGLNIHRDTVRRRPEVLRLLAYAKAGLPTISEVTDDPLLEFEFNQSAVVFLPYHRISVCAARLLKPEAESLRLRLRRNALRLARLRQEHLVLEPVLSVLFPGCSFTT